MSWILYGILIVAMVYMMSKGGGCCGGGLGNHQGEHTGHNGHSGGGCCGGGSNHGHMDNAESNYQINDSEDILNKYTVVDPVCGMSISKANSIYRQINGKMYYFCSERCAQEFQRKMLLNKAVE